MKVTPIAEPMPGEHLAATWPTMRLDLDDPRPRTDPQWRQRMRFWSGRAVTADALERDQDNRAASLAWHARITSAGIVTGLEAAFEPQARPIELQILTASTRTDLPATGTSLAIIAQLDGGDGLYFRVFDADQKKIRDLADTAIAGRDDARTHLRELVAGLGDPTAPTPAERDDLLRELSGLLEYRLPLAGHFLHLLPGHGITAVGDDVTLPRALRVDLAEVPVRDSAAGATPWAAVLVVRPAEFGRFDNIDPQDPCELDPSRDAFADERRQDAALLELVTLPVEWLVRPELGDADDPRWRNRLAALIFSDQAERAARLQIRFREPLPPGQRWDTFLAAEDLRPWEFDSVPVALLSSELVPGATDRTWFLDRATVVRRGGQARTRPHPAVRIGMAAPPAALNPAGSGTPSLWRARVDQFAEHFGALDPATDIAARTARFQFLPPAGLLPKEALTFLTTADATAINARDRAATSHVFPAAIPVEAVPMPVEDLDAALAASAALAPIDLAASAGDPVRMIVPLPQKVFDPDLLVIEQEDPIFLQEIGRLVAERQDWRQRRDFVQAQQRTLQQIATGPLPPFTPPALERGQLETEPVEIRGTNGFTAVLASPVATDQPIELRVTFPPRVVSETTILYARLRTDNEGDVPPITLRWRSGAQEFSEVFATPPAYPLERHDANGLPLATPLWRDFRVTAGDLGISSRRSLTAFTLHLDSGQVAIADAGELVTGQSSDELVENPWWRAQETIADITVEQIGGAWTLVSDGRELVPFEDDYVPQFDDNRTVAQRTAELDAALNPATAIPRQDRAGRNIKITVATDGLEKVLVELDAESNEVDDFVDAFFTRTQTNLYRIRKLILGETAAQRLLINPAIATIAEQETANASAEQLASFVAAAKGKTVPAAEVNSALGAKAAPPPAPRSFTAFTATNLIVTDFFKFQPKAELRFVEAAVPTKTAVLKDVLGQRAEAGPTLPPRGLTIGKRFEEPKATNNLSYARAGLVELVDQLPSLRLPLDGEPVLPVDRNATPTAVLLLDLQGRSVARDGKDAATLRAEAREAILKVGALPEKDAAGADIPIDEAEVTLAALDFTETKSAILRTIEKIVLDRRATLARGRDTLAVVQSIAARAANRVGAIAPRLGEARHDVSVARALRQEEQARIATINDRRDAIIRDDVTFLAFVRPRVVDPVRRVATSWRLESADQPGEVPGCLARHDEPPDELRAYIQLFRQAPARWFTAIAPRLQELNTREKLVQLLDATRTEAIRFTAAKTIPFAPASIAIAPLAALQSAHALVSATRADAARLTLATGNAVSWAEQQRAATQYASLGTVIDGRHGHPALARAAADELENFESVSACLHAEFAGVAPAIRLGWVERYSQFDRPSPLQDLTMLPNYGALPRETRRHFQALVDWLFSRIDRTQRDAVSLINDLVRICLLLASHAPVKQLIAGHVPRPVVVRPGVLVPIKPLDPNLVRVGMEFHVWQASTVVARGLVEDLRDGEVSARVNDVTTGTTTTTIDQTMRVQFVAPAFAFTASAPGTRK